MRIIRFITEAVKLTINRFYVNMRIQICAASSIVSVCYSQNHFFYRKLSSLWTLRTEVDLHKFNYCFKILVSNFHSTFKSTRCACKIKYKWWTLESGCLDCCVKAQKYLFCNFETFVLSFARTSFHEFIRLWRHFYKTMFNICSETLANSLFA